MLPIPPLPTAPRSASLSTLRSFLRFLLLLRTPPRARAKLGYNLSLEAASDDGFPRLPGSTSNAKSNGRSDVWKENNDKRVELLRII
jgi:hypothetical protein